MRQVRGAVAAVALAVLATSCPRPSRPTSSSAHPKLVVLIVVDQLPAWTFEKQRRLLAGGFARLLRDGVYWPRAELPYAYTYTAPGHAAIATGAPPAASGVIANTWYRRAEQRTRPAEYDPDAPIIFQPGTVPEGALGPDDGASGKGLRVPGVAEALRLASPTSRSVAVSLKARSACFLAGQRPDLVLWFDEVIGGFTTSAAYRSSVPTWITELAREKPWSRFAAAVWTPADPDLLARETGIADDAPGEAVQGGFGTTFPHDLATATDPVRAIHFTPFADEMLTDVAIAALGGEHLGEDAAPDLLAIGYSSHDFASHVWGQGSWEQLDLLLQLDRQLARLFDALDAKLGASGYAVVLTSDHGATPIVETSPHRGARRIPVDSVELVAEQAIAKVLGAGDWVATITGMEVYLSPAFEAVDDARRRDDAIKAAVDAIRMIPGVRDAGRLAPMAAGCPSGEDMARLCLSYAAGESGDIYLVPVDGSLITEYTSGTHHDAPSADNRVVPVIVSAPGIAPRTSYEAVSILRIAPTVANLLGAAAPASAQAPALELVPPPPAASAPAKNAE